MRLDFLDGLRGWASFVVLLSHLIQCWLSTRFLPDDLGILLERGHPLYFLLDGSSAIQLFFVISGFSLSVNFFADNDINKILKMAFFRYFRLAIPIFFSSLWVFFLLKNNLNWNYKIPNSWPSAMYIFDPTYYNLLKFSFYDSIFTDDLTIRGQYNNVTWTLPIEFSASFLIFGFLCIFGKFKMRYTVYAILGYFFPVIIIKYLLFFIGLFIADIYKYLIKISSYFKKMPFLYDVIMIFFFMCCIFYMPNTIWIVSGNTISVSLLLMAVIVSPSLKWFFSNKLSKFLGRISFSLYLTHISILCTFSSWLYLTLQASGCSPHKIALCVLLSSVVLCLAVARIFCFLVEENILVYIRKILLNHVYITLKEFIFYLVNITIIRPSIRIMNRI